MSYSAVIKTTFGSPDAPEVGEDVEVGENDKEVVNDIT